MSRAVFTTRQVMPATLLMRLLSPLLLLALPVLAAAPAFPKIEDARRVRGELISADFIHRSGQIRTEKGERIDFTMPPPAIMKYRGAEADLRDVPPGTRMDFLLLPSETGRPAPLLTTDDGQKPDPEQRRKFREFTEKRGIAGWITKTEGKQVTVQLFSGDPSAFQEAYGELLAKGRSTRTCVANDELRTWNPPVDGENGSIQEARKLPADRFGFSGHEITVSVSNMLEGFRRGRIVRIFLQGWKAQDQFYGESLMGYGFSRMQNRDLVENVAKEYPEQFPFRTDHGNFHLPWHQLKEGLSPPPFSEHLVFGELTRIDDRTGAGRFLTEKTGEPVDFTLIAKPVLRHLGRDARAADLPPNQRYRFHCFQDSGGAFTRIALISDDISHLAANATTARIVSTTGGRIHAAWQLALVKDYNGDMQRPPDIGAGLLDTGADTTVLKNGRAVPLSSLKAGDEIRVNVAAELPGRPCHITEVQVVLP
jgi:hypothetical protein